MISVVYSMSVSYQLLDSRVVAIMIKKLILVVYN